MIFCNYSVGSIPRGVLACFLPKSRDMQAKMPSPKVILNAFWLVTVKVLNSYKRNKRRDRKRKGDGTEKLHHLFLKYSYDTWK